MKTSSSVVGDADDVVVQQLDGDEVAVARHRLVDRVVDDLVDEVVQSAGAGRADVHAGTHPHGLEPFEHLDLFCAVFLCYLFLFHGFLLVVKYI